MSPSRGKLYYPYVLEHKPGFFLGWLLYRLFKTVKMDESMREELKRMHRQGTVVYAIKYRSHLDYVLYHYNFRRRRLPYPRVAFDLNMSLLLPLKHLLRVLVSQLSSLFRYGHLPSPYQSGFYKKAVQGGTPSLISLVDPKRFHRHYIHAEMYHLQFLLETQRDMARPVYIVPQLVLYKKSPERDNDDLASIFFGYKDNPGFIRKIALFFRHHNQALIDFGEPLDLKAYLESQPPDRPLRDMAEELRRVLIEGIDVQKRVVLGPIMKSRQQLKEIVLMDSGVSARIQDLAGGGGRKLRQLRRKAGEYFDEIAADYNITYIQFFQLALSWFWKKVFEGIEVDSAGLAKVREWARKGPLIYVPSHKSHIDYLILNYVLYNYHMHIPRVAAGKNLAFWPMGHVFRKCGAFFIRRTFKGARLYAEVFNRYVKSLIAEGHPIEFFIEGGRSRNGKLVLPKTGFLSILLQAYREGYCNDLIFVPTSIIYDRILEENAYLKELGGERKTQESLFEVIKARHFLNRKYGKVYIRFSRPFSLSEYLTRTVSPEKELQRDLAFHLVQSINAVSLVTPLSVVATAILSNHRRGFYASELAQTVGVLLDFMRTHDVPVAATLTEAAKAVKETLSLLINWKIVDYLEGLEGEEEETFYYVEEDKKMELEYYKNSIIHFLVPHAFVAVSLLSGTEEIKMPESIGEDYAFLRRLFKHEFVFHEKEDIRETVLSVIDYFARCAFLTRGAEDTGYKVTKLGFDRLPIWAALAKTYLESYWIAAKSMTKQKGKEKKETSLLKNMNYLGKRFHRLGVVEHIGALSQLNFKNAMRSINENVLNGQVKADEPAVAAERLTQFGQRLYELSHYSQ